MQFFVNTNVIANQNQVNYCYKLTGFDKEWTMLFNSNEIKYRNLPAGNYSLIIKASLSTDFTKVCLIGKDDIILVLY